VKASVNSRTNLPRQSFRNCSVLTGGLLGFKLVLQRVWLRFAGVAGPNLVVASALPGVVERGVSVWCDGFGGSTNAGLSGLVATDTLGAGAVACQQLVTDFVGAGIKRGKPSRLTSATGLLKTQP
jgi:hypothetical protein